MDKIRRHEYNRINDEIRNIDMSIDKTEASATRMRHQASNDFIIAQISKINKKNTERRDMRDKLLERLKHLKSGLLDDDLRTEMQKQMTEAAEKTRITTKKKSDIKADKAAQSVISKAYYIASRRQDRKNKYANKNMGRSYRHFTRACRSIPNYMRRNLSEMPSNKGYFWKSVACYGDLPAERNKPTVLFDRKRGGIMVIHEWTPTEYKVYEKKGKEKKILVSCTKRRHVVLPPVPPEVQKRREETRRRARRPRSRTFGRKISSGRDRPRTRPQDKTHGRGQYRSNKGESKNTGRLPKRNR